MKNIFELEAQFLNEFNELVTDISYLCREYRHSTNANQEFVAELLNFNGFMNDVKTMFTTTDRDECYVYHKMLDALDYIMDSELWDTKTNPTANSIYTAIQEFYFNN